MADRDARNPDDDGQQVDARLDGDFTEGEDLDDEELAEIESSLRKAAMEHRIDLPTHAQDESRVMPPELGQAGSETDEELEAQIAEAEARLKAALSDEADEIVPDFEAHIPAYSQEDPLDPDLRERVDNFGRKLDEIGAKRDSRNRAKKSQSQLDRDAARGLGVGMMVAYLIIGVPLGGALIGYLIDRGSGGGNATAIGVVAGAIVGVAMAISVMNRANRE